mgnify:CR=1 FL=1
MTVDEMHLQFKIGVDKTDSFNSANFTPAEIDIYLSDAQEQFIEQRAYGNNYKRDSLEETQQRVKNLQSLVMNATIIPLATTADNKPYGSFVELPSDYRHAIEEEVLMTYIDCNKATQQQRVPVVALQHDKYARAVTNPFSKPNLNKVYRLPFGRFNSKEHFELVSASGYTISAYYLRYIKNPAKINLANRTLPVPSIGTGQQGELADEAYREIIRVAVRNALGDIESPRTQESMQRINEIE